MQFDEASSELLSYSLLRRLPETSDVSIHRLVQAVLQDELDQATQQRWAEAILKALADLFPYGEYENWECCQRYLPHAMRCAEYIEQWHITSAEAAHLLHKVATYLKARAQYPEAEPLYQRALAIREQVEGPEHPSTAAILNNLANLYKDQGRYELAEPLYQRALAIREQVEGPAHPSTATTLNNLGFFYFKQGKYEQAEPLYLRSLAISEKMLGPAHPSTAGTVHNLALLYDRQGKYELAEPLYQRALAIKEKVLGPEHPETLQTLQNYADLLRKVGRDQEAAALEAQINAREAKEHRSP